MITSALLGSLLSEKANLAFYTVEQVKWSEKYAGIQKKVAAEEKKQAAYEKAYDAAMNNNKELKAGGITVSANNINERIAEQYALAISDFDESAYKELVDLDTEYDTMNTLYATMIEQSKAKIKSLESATSQAAQSTEIIRQS
ncbi:MAG: hypothetical protein Q4E83_02930 [bacterium]|nr:hypothetical protein [bacterium]